MNRRNAPLRDKKKASEAGKISRNKEKPYRPYAFKKEDVKEAVIQQIHKTLDDHKNNLSKWLDQVANESPYRALQAYVVLLEWLAPRPPRHEEDKTMLVNNNITEQKIIITDYKKEDDEGKNTG